MKSDHPDTDIQLLRDHNTLASRNSGLRIKRSGLQNRSTEDHIAGGRWGTDHLSLLAK